MHQVILQTNEYCIIYNNSIKHLQRMRRANRGNLLLRHILSCPTLGLASILMLRPISSISELVLFPDFRVSNISRYFYFASYTCTYRHKYRIYNMLMAHCMYLLGKSIIKRCCNRFLFTFLLCNNKTHCQRVDHSCTQMLLIVIVSYHRAICPALVFQKFFLNTTRSMFHISYSLDNTSK